MTFFFSLIFNSVISIDINVFIFLPLTFFFYPVTSQDKGIRQDFLFYNKRLYKQTEVKLKIDFKSEIGCSDWLVTFNKRTNHGS